MIPLFLVIHEGKDVLGRHAFLASPKTFATWEAADAEAKLRSNLHQVRSWVVQIARPALVELVPANK